MKMREISIRRVEIPVQEFLSKLGLKGELKLLYNEWYPEDKVIIEVVEV